MFGAAATAPKRPGGTSAVPGCPPQLATACPGHHRTLPAKPLMNWLRRLFGLRAPASAPSPGAGLEPPPWHPPEAETVVALIGPGVSLTLTTRLHASRFHGQPHPGPAVPGGVRRGLR